MMTSLRLALAAVVLGLVLTLAGCTGGGTSATGFPNAPGDAVAAPDNAAALQQAYVSVVARVLPSIAQITTGNSLGSGVVFDAKGDIVTNAHVVGSATTFQVRLANSPTTYTAHLVDAYPPDDLAVIRLDSPPGSLHPAHFGDSSKLADGDIVLAMGNPLGLTGSVTEGIISGVGRTVSEAPGGGSPGATLPEAIQTSAAINPGNSGGALVNLAGDVIGVPTLAAVEPGIDLGGSLAPGIGFAIASNLVTDIAGQIATSGHVTNSHRAELGVQVVAVVDQNGQPTGAGIEDVVPNGPAAAAGLRAGDVITAVNNTPVTGTSGLAAVLAHLDPGQKATVTVIDQQGQTRTVTVTLGQLPGS